MRNGLRKRLGGWIALLFAVSNFFLFCLMQARVYASRKPVNRKKIIFQSTMAGALGGGIVMYFAKTDVKWLSCPSGCIVTGSTQGAQDQCSCQSGIFSRPSERLRSAKTGDLLLGLGGGGLLGYLYGSWKATKREKRQRLHYQPAFHFYNGSLTPGMYFSVPLK